MLKMIFFFASQELYFHLFVQKYELLCFYLKKKSVKSMIVLQFNCPGWTSKILSSSGQQVAPQSSSPFADPPAAL